MEEEVVRLVSDQVDPIQKQTVEGAEQVEPHQELLRNGAEPLEMQR